MSLPDLKPFRSVWGLISSNSAATSANYDTINIFTQKKCAQTFIRMTVCVGVFGSEMQQLGFFFSFFFFNRAINVFCMQLMPVCHHLTNRWAQKPADVRAYVSACSPHLRYPNINRFNVQMSVSWLFCEIVSESLQTLTAVFSGDWGVTLAFTAVFLVHVPSVRRVSAK